jgi:hypothetical protein
MDIVLSPWKALQIELPGIGDNLEMTTTMNTMHRDSALTPSPIRETPSPPREK